MDFQATDEVLALGVRGACVLVSELNNSTRSPKVEEWRTALFASLCATLTDASLADCPILKGFRELHQAVGRSNRKYPASAEALLTRVLKSGKLPSLNAVVDIYNGVSLETRLSLGAHDVRAIVGNVTLRLTKGDERFVPLGAVDPEPVGAGEYCYLDDTPEVLCRLEHRQVEKTKITENSSSVFYIVQGNAHTSQELISQALERLLQLTSDACGGRLMQTWNFP